MGFLRNWRRRRVAARHDIDEALWQSVVRELPFLRGMAESELARLRSLALLFLDEKEMHGAARLELTDAMRVSIAAQEVARSLERRRSSSGLTSIVGVLKALACRYCSASTCFARGTV